MVKLTKENFSKLMYLWFAISFVISGILVCGILCTISTILIWPFSKRLYRKLGFYCAYTMFAQGLFMFLFWAKVNFKLYVKKETYEKYMGKENALCVVNHSGELDWIAMAAFADQFHILGNLKAYIKNSVKYIPFLGWGYYYAENIFLSRSFTKDKVVLEKAVGALMEYEEPIWILLFAEGTRFVLEKHELSKKFCRERGLKELEHHLMPRTKGFSTSIPVMREKVPAVYDMEIAFSGVKPTISNVIKGKTFDIHLYLKRIPMEEVPEGEKESEEYLRDIFYKKDAMMDSFKKTGNFAELSGVENYEAIDLSPSKSIFYNTLAWMALTWGPIIYKLINSFASGQYVFVCVFIATIFLSFNVLSMAIDAIQVKQENINKIKSAVKLS